MNCDGNNPTEPTPTDPIPTDGPSDCADQSFLTLKKIEKNPNFK